MVKPGLTLITFTASMKMYCSDQVCALTGKPVGLVTIITQTHNFFMQIKNMAHFEDKNFNKIELAANIHTHAMHTHTHTHMHTPQCDTHINTYTTFSE